MKTKIAHLTATILAAVALAPAAFAAPVYGPKPSHGFKSQAAPNCCEAGACNTKGCCTTKRVSTGSAGYGRQIFPAKRVIDCNGNCPVAAQSQPAVCKKGSRA